MKNYILSFLAVFILQSLALAKADTEIQFILKNKLNFERTNETVVVPLSQPITNISSYALFDESNKVVSYQYNAVNSTIVFQLGIPANATKTYTLKAGTPTVAATKTYAAQKIPATRNDIAWENDLAAYRMYSKVLLKTEPNTANGVDLWVKKQSEPMIDKMYSYANYHAEQTEGVDAYSVNGKTLGVGGVAAYVGNKLWLHDPYDECTIVANGALYSEFVLTYNKVLIDGDYYTKTVRISTTANGLLNKAVVKLEGRNKAMKIASGIYLHTNMSGVTPAGTQFKSEVNLIGYAENKSEGTVTSPNARFYEGVYMPGETTVQTIDNHLVIMSDYAVGSEFTFYFGGGWNIFPSGRYTKDQDWFDALSKFKQTVSSSLVDNSTALPTKSEVINTAIKVNSLWQTDRIATVLDKNWYSGVYHTGNMLIYSLYPRKSYLDYSKTWAVNNAWDINSHSSADADSYTAAQTYIDLYNMDEVKDSKKISAIKTRVDSKLTDNQSAEWWWIDAMYMAMPVYARVGALTGDNKYFEKMYKLFKNCRDTLLVSSNTVLWTTALRGQYGTGPIVPNFADAPDGLYNKEVGLWWRDWGFQPGVPNKYDPNNGSANNDTDPQSEFCAKSTPNGKNIFWGRGNGWAIGAMAHTLTHTPAGAPHRQEYVDILQTMAEALRTRQREDGFWNMSLDDPNHLPAGETSGTALITYAMAWGINNHLLDSATYYPTVAKAWNALSTQAMQPNGVVYKIQGEGEAPVNPNGLMNSRSSDKKVAFGVGAFLCAAAEVAKLAPGEMPQAPVSSFDVESVELMQANKLKVSFSADVDQLTATDAENYLIQDAPAIESVVMSGAKATILTFSSDIDYGIYALKVFNVKGADNSLIDSENAVAFIRSVPTTALDYSVTVTAIGNQAGNPPPQTIENTLDTRWAQAGKNQWINYDMGKVVDVYAVDIAYYLGTTRLSYFNIQTSVDGANYTTILANQQTSGLTNEMERYKFPTSVKARHIRIMCNGNSTGGENWNSITEVRIRFNLSAGIKTPKRLKSLCLFPNPLSTDYLTVQADDSFRFEKVIISDLAGKTVYVERYDSSLSSIELNLNHLPHGLYVLSAFDKNSHSENELLIKK